MYAKIVVFLSMPFILHASDQNNMVAAPPDPSVNIKTAEEIIRTLDDKQETVAKGYVVGAMAGWGAGSMGACIGSGSVGSCLAVVRGCGVGGPAGALCGVVTSAAWAYGAPACIRKAREQRVIDVLQWRAWREQHNSSEPVEGQDERLVTANTQVP